MAIQYTFYSAIFNRNMKSGTNRIEWDDCGIPAPNDYINTKDSDIDNAGLPKKWGWVERTREYIPEDAPLSLSDAQIIAAFQRLKELGLIK